MSPEELIQEYETSIKVYKERIRELRSLPPPLSGTQKRRLACMEAALADMQYALGVFKRDIRTDKITPRRWIL